LTILTRAAGKCNKGKYGRAVLLAALAQLAHDINSVASNIFYGGSIMVEGESGILAACPDSERPKYPRPSSDSETWGQVFH
jgi:hypothetical protein